MAKQQNKTKWGFMNSKGESPAMYARLIYKELSQYELADLDYDRYLQNNKYLRAKDFDERRQWRNSHLKNIKAKILGLLKASGEYNEEHFEREYQHLPFFQQSLNYANEYEFKFRKEKYI